METEEFQALDRRLAGIEACCAELVGSLEKLRTTAHRMVDKMMVLDDLGTSLDVVANLAKTMSELVPKVGHLIDRVEHLEDHHHG